MAGLFDDLLQDDQQPGGLFDDLLTDAPAPPRTTRRGGTRSEASAAIETTTGRGAGGFSNTDPRRVDLPQRGAPSVLDQPTRGEADPLLNPDFIAGVRSEFAAMPELQRLPALRDMANRSDARGRAARQILRDVEAENAAAFDASQQQGVFVDALAGAPATARSGGSARPAPVAMPEPNQVVALARGDSPDQSLQRDRASRAVATGDTSMEAIADRAQRRARDFEAEDFAAANPLTGALASGAARQLRGAINIGDTVLDFAARLAGLPATGGDGMSPTSYSAELKRQADSLMPKVGRQPMAEAWDRGEFGGWLASNLVAQAPQIAQSIVAAFVPGAQGIALTAMGAQAAGNKFADTGRSDAAVLSGLVEAGSEMLPLKAFHHSFNALRALPPAAQGQVVQAIGRAIPAVAGAVTLQGVVGSIEELAAQVGNNVIDAALLGERKDLLDGAAEAAVIGAFASKAMSVPQGVGALVRAGQSRERQFADAFSADVAGTDLAGAPKAGWARVSGMQPFDGQAAVPAPAPAPIRVEDMPTTVMSPEQIAALASGARARQAAEAAPAADLAAAPARGEANLGIATVSQGSLAAAAEEQLRRNAASATGESDVGIPGEPGPVAGSSGDSPGGDLARGMGGAGPAAGAAAGGLDPNAAPPAPGGGSPASVRAGVPADEALSNGASLPQRQAGGAGPADQRSDDEVRAAYSGRYESERTRAADAAVTYREKAGAIRRETAAMRRAGTPELIAQADQLDTRADGLERASRLFEQRAAATPSLKSPPPKLQASFARMQQALHDTFGRRVVPYFDERSSASDGFADDGVTFINLARPERSVAFTAFHELQHIVRAEAAGGNATSQLATQMLDQVWGMIDESAKRMYATKYLFRQAVADGAMTEEQALQSDKLRDEMLSDFMGKRATDRGFLTGLANKHPEQFSAFIGRWIDALKNLIASLRGKRDAGGLKDVDQAIRNLDRARIVAEGVLRTWADSHPGRAGAGSRADGQSPDGQGQADQRRSEREGDPAEQRGAEGSDRQPGKQAGREGGSQRSDAAGDARNGALAAEAGRPVSYGTPRQGASTVVAYHYSKQDRTVLSSAMFGTGLAGAEASRVAGTLAQRINFYIDRGTGINPEAGVGGRAHRVELRNVYDGDEDALRLIRGGGGPSDIEQRIVDAGFDGYFTRDAGPSGQVVLLGRHNVPVEQLGAATRLKAEKPVPAARPRQLTAPERIAANKALPSGQAKGPRWRELVRTMMPAEYAELQDHSAWETNEPLYRDEIARRLAADTSVPTRRNSDREGNELGAFNLDQAETIVADDFFGDADELTDEQREEVNAELQIAMGYMGAQPVRMRYEVPTDDALKTVGIMAESAYKPLEYSDDGTTDVTFVAPWSSGAKQYTFVVEDEGDGDFNALPAERTGEGAGYGLSLRRVSREAAEGYNRRVAASIDLTRRGFDLFTAVPAASRKRVQAAWQKIGSLPGAFEFKRVDPMAYKGLPPVAMLQSIGVDMLKGSQFGFEAGATDASGWYKVTLTDKRMGTEVTAQIEFIGGADKRLVVHSANLERGSSVGKALYQPVFAWAAALGIPVVSDRSLTGVNTYRRTEQMMAAAVRAGDTSGASPGIAQRIYGWNARARDATQRERNLVRLALAAARNAAELVPRVRDLAYDIGRDRFSWRRGKDKGGDAEAFVKESLAERDVRALSLSRSTLARASVTFQAIDDELELSEVSKAASPILYSAREMEAGGEYAGIGDPFGANYNALSGRSVTFRAAVGGTGEFATITADAATYLRNLDERLSALKSIRNCLAT